MQPRPKQPKNSNVLVRLLAGIVLVSVILLLCSNLVVLHQHGSSPTHLLETSLAPWSRSNPTDPCQNEYDRLTNNRFRTPGLTTDDLMRSRAYPGNQYRMSQLTRKLQSKEQPHAVNVVVCGGSISLGHGVTPTKMRYSNQLEGWLNEMYPLPDESTTHKVWNKGSHGADMCAMAKRINLLGLADIEPDLFVLEFSVNDYQGQDHRIHIDHKTDVFFDGFERLALCAETVVYKLLTDFPNAAVVFLEFQTAILNRKTAQLLHMGVAQHYQVPVLSYADVMFPPLIQLARQLEPYGYSLPPNAANIPSTDGTAPPSSILPYPHGCTACQAEHIIPQFRDKGCKSVCVFLQRSGFTPPGTTCDAAAPPCYTSFLAHDAVHPSAVGHGIAKDLLVELIATTGREVCRHVTMSAAATAPSAPAYTGWMVAGHDYAQQLRALSDFDVVFDTMQIFARQDPLLSKNHSTGFALRGDQLADRKGWISTNPAGGEYIVFDIELPTAPCYAVVLSVLHSYETVGSFSVTVQDVHRQTSTQPVVHDCVWKPQISIPADILLTEQGGECTGHCQVVVKTLPEIHGRKGNTIKITSLAVRKCTKA